MLINVGNNQKNYLEIIAIFISTELLQTFQNIMYAHPYYKITGIDIG